MFSVTVAQQTGTAKLLTLFQRFQTKVHTLRVNETKITGENAFIGDHFRTEGNHESNYNENTLFWVYFQIFDPSFNP